MKTARNEVDFLIIEQRIKSQFFIGRLSKKNEDADQGLNYDKIEIISKMVRRNKINDSRLEQAT